MARVNIALLAVLALLCFAGTTEAAGFGRLARKLMAYACTVDACANAQSGPGLVSAFSNAQNAELVSDHYNCNFSSFNADCAGLGPNVATSAGRK